MPARALRVFWITGLLAAAPAGYGLDVHLQELPPAPGLTPSAALDPLAGLREALNCGLDFLGTAQRCGLSAPAEVAAPFAVTFDPLFCRLTMRFSIGEMIDGLLKQWIAGALSRIGSPAVGALCLLGIGPQFCGAASTAAPRRSPVVPPSALQRSTAARAGSDPSETAPSPPPPPPSEEPDHAATGFDHLVR